MKKIFQSFAGMAIIVLLAVAGMLGGCEDVNDRFDQHTLDSLTSYYNTPTYNYTLATTDYAKLSSLALVAAKNATDSTAAINIAAHKYFSETELPDTVASLLLNTISTYKYADNGASLMLTYNYYEEYDTAKIATANKYTLVTADYDAMGTASGQPGQYDNFSSSISPTFFIPIWLKITYPYAKSGDVKLIRYQYYSGSATAEQKLVFVYDGSAWASFATITEQVAKYKYANGGWNFVDTDIIVGLNANTGLSSNLGDFVAVSVSGAEVWAWNTYGYMKITGYVSGVYYTNEDWLVSPAMDLSERGDSTFLTFDHTGRYFGNDFLVGIKKSVSVWVSTSNFDGVTINPDNWTELSIPDTNFPSGTNWNFVTVKINLKEYAGKSGVRIALKYVSSAEDAYAGTWEVKNFYVYEKQ